MSRKLVAATGAALVVTAIVACLLLTLCFSLYRLL